MRRNSAAGFVVSGMMRLFVALIILLIGAASSAHAQATARLQVRQFGWQGDGSLSSGSWNPVLVHVSGAAATNRFEGRAGDAQARVLVVLKLAVSNGSGRAGIYPLGAYGQDVALPPGVDKDLRIWVYAPSDGAYVASVQLGTTDGQVIEEQSVQGQASRGDIPLIGTIADSSTLAAQLGRIEIPYQQGLTAQLRVNQIAAGEVPPNAEYLQAFRALVLQGSMPSTLDGEQRRALQDWVIQGGHLLVVGGPDAGRAASVLDSPSAPLVKFANVEGSTDLTALADWIAPGTPLGSGPAARIEATTGDTLAGTTARPIAQRASWGAGSVTLLATDPTLDPLRGWSITPILLRRALEPALAPDRATDQSRFGTDPRFADLRLVDALDALPPQVFPDWQQVGLLLVVFALLAGPVLHLLLWRADRRPLLWIAVPALSVAFTIAIYLLSGAVPGRDVVANAVSEVRMDARSGDARQSVAVGFFAPLRDRLTVRSAAELPIRVWTGSTSGASGSQAVATGLTAAFGSSFGAPLTDAGIDPPYRVMTGRDTKVEFSPAAINQSGLRTVIFSRSLATAGRLEADLRIEGTEGLIRGTVRNSTPYALDQVGIGVGLNLVKLGPIAPGQTVPVSFDPRTPPPMAPTNVAYPLAWQMFGSTSSTLRSGNFGPSLDLPTDPDLRRRLRLLDAVLARGDRSRVTYYGSGSQPYAQSAPTAPILIALSSALIGDDAIPNAGAQRTYQLTVFDESIELPIAPGPFRVAPILLPPTVSVEPGATLGNNTYQGYGGPVWLDLRGAATYTFRAQLPTTTRVDAIALKTAQSNAQVVTSGTPTVALGPSNVVVTRGGDTPVPGARGTFNAFNWATSTWEPITASGIETILSPAAQYIGPNGVVRVQVNSGGRDRALRYQPPELTIMGEVAQ
jgi:hypothetical protein